MKTRLLAKPSTLPVRYAPALTAYLKKYHQFYLMLIPVVAFYIVFKYLPSVRDRHRVQGLQHLQRRSRQ